eukprot:PhM_4_TR5208/c0_g1_i2/m.50913
MKLSASFRYSSSLNRRGFPTSAHCKFTSLRGLTTFTATPLSCTYPNVLSGAFHRTNVLLCPKVISVREQATFPQASRTRHHASSEYTTSKQQCAYHSGVRRADHMVQISTDVFACTEMDPCRKKRSRMCQYGAACRDRTSSCTFAHSAEELGSLVAPRHRPESQLVLCAKHNHWRWRDAMKGTNDNSFECSDVSPCRINDVFGPSPILDARRQPSHEAAAVNIGEDVQKVVGAEHTKATKEDAVPTGDNVDVEFIPMLRRTKKPLPKQPDDTVNNVQSDNINNLRNSTSSEIKSNVRGGANTTSKGITTITRNKMCSLHAAFGGTCPMGPYCRDAHTPDELGKPVSFPTSEKAAYFHRHPVLTCSAHGPLRSKAHLEPIDGKFDDKGKPLMRCRPEHPCLIVRDRMCPQLLTAGRCFLDDESKCKFAHSKEEVGTVVRMRERTHAQRCRETFKPKVKDLGRLRAVHGVDSTTVRMSVQCRLHRCKRKLVEMIEVAPDVYECSVEHPCKKQVKCAVHNAWRLESHMEALGDDGEEQQWVCKRGHECKKADLMTCAVHGKRRHSEDLVKMSDGRFRCKEGSECFT